MHRSQFWLLVPLLLLSLLPRSLAAQDADMLTGRIVGPDGKAVAGVRVEAISIETEISRSVLTGSNGRYMILFPDGGGSYLVRVSFIGYGDQARLVFREGEEELLVADFKLEQQAIQLDGLTVTGRVTPSRRGDAGGESTELTQEYLESLPLSDMDPATLALLAAGVIATELDSLDGEFGFSVAGMSDLLNQITLDGVELGENAVGVPEEGIRRTRVTTSTFDVSRGGFAGGQVSMTTARGNNRPSGSFSYRLDDDAFQMNSSAITSAFTRQNLGGSWGGPIIRNRLFYNGSFQVSRFVNHRYALAADDPLAALRSGVNIDSIGRFLSILEDTYNFPAAGQTGRYNQVNDDLRLQGRVDWQIRRSQGQSHTLSSRFNFNLRGQDSTRINSLDLAQHGGETERNNRLGAITFNSRIGANWTNTVGLSYSHSWNDALPFAVMPEGRVRITSELEDGTRSTRNLIFGGNRGLPSEGSSHNVQFSNNLSFLLPIGNHLHRLKVGGSLQRVRDRRLSSNNLFGTFTYHSLDNFEANDPDRFERTLSDREAVTGRFNAGLFVGDTWRISYPLEVTLGVRWDYSKMDQRPEYNPALEAAFGRRNDVTTSANGFSPRLGFNYRLSKTGQSPRILSGGVGYFRGRAPTSIYSAAIRQTGLSEADQRLICIGRVVPIPDWDNFIDNLDAVPTECADGGPGSPPSLSVRSPNVTLINPRQALPTSLRADLGYQTRLPLKLTGNFRYGYSRGIGLWGYRDINLDSTKTFVLEQEGRTFYGDHSGIVKSTGNVSRATSRIHEDFGLVYDVNSELESETHQFTTRINGMVTPKLRFNLNHTLGFSREQTTGFRGGTTAGDPNATEWSVSNNDRRHILGLVLTYSMRPEVQFALIGRAVSGMPFTPIVNRDINGDGIRNDRAFIFDPADAPTPELAEGMTRLLKSVPTPVRRCLESQMGRIADRNSCRNSWTQTLDFRASLRPNLPRVQRRMTISIDGRNTLTGLDQIINGRQNMKGWGDGRRADNSLLEVQRFDVATNSFIYEVNEGFGQARRGPNAFRRPFSLTLSARLLVGGPPSRANRGFGPRPPRARRGGRTVASGNAALRPLGPLAGVFRGGMRDSAFDLDSAMTAALYNPVPRFLEYADSVELGAEQSTAIQAVADTLAEHLAGYRAELTPIVERHLTSVREQGASGRGQNSRPRMTPELVQRAQEEVAPHLAGVRKETASALKSVQAIMTEAQWERLPEPVRRGRRPGRQRAAPSFNAVAAIDQALANPLQLVIGMREEIALTDDQVARVRELSEKLQVSLNKKRGELGQKFDNLPAQQHARRFDELRPEIEAAQREISRSLHEVKKVLQAEQWGRIPSQLRDPFSRSSGQQAQQAR